MNSVLKDIADVRIGYQLRGRLEHDPSGSHRIIQMRDVRENGAIRAAGLTTFSPKRDPDSYLVEPGDVLFLARGNRNGAYVPQDLGDTTVASNHFFIITPDATRMRPKFLAWYLNTRPVQAYVQSSAQGTTVMLVQRVAVEKIKIDVPPLAVQDHVIKLVELRDTERRLIKHLEARRDALIEAVCLDALDKSKEKERMNV